MWIMNRYGFISIVEKPEDRDQGTLTVRARDRRSLEAFAYWAGFPDYKAALDIGTDYPYRQVFHRDEVDQAVLALLNNIDYTNFKDAAKAELGAVYANALGRVWGTMHALTPPSVTKKVRAKFRAEDAALDKWLAERAAKIP